MASDMVDMFITAIVAFALLPVLVSYIADLNLTGAVGALATIVPVLYVIIVVGGFAYALKKRK